MKRLVVSALFAVSASVFAEVKPFNTVLDKKCGYENRSEYICLASSGHGGNEYIVFRHFLKKEDLRIAKVDHKWTERRVGATTTTYLGTALYRNGNYIREAEMKMVTTHVVRPGSSETAELWINGRKMSHNPVTLEGAVHTESIR